MSFGILNNIPALQAEAALEHSDGASVRLCSNSPRANASTPVRPIQQASRSPTAFSQHCCPQSIHPELPITASVHCRWRMAPCRK